MTHSHPAAEVIPGRRGVPAGHLTTGLDRFFFDEPPLRGCVAADEANELTVCDSRVNTRLVAFASGETAAPIDDVAVEHAFAFWYYGLRGLSLLLLATALAPDARPTAVRLGLKSRLDATVPPTLKLATTCFGRVTGVAMFAWTLAGHQLGAGVTAYLAGLTRIWTSSHDLAFVTSGMLCMIRGAEGGVRSRSAHVAKPLPRQGSLNVQRREEGRWPY